LNNLAHCQAHTGHARRVSTRAVQVGSEIPPAGHIFINPGAHAAVPDISGLDQVSYLTNSAMSISCRAICWCSAAPASVWNSARCIGGSAAGQHCHGIGLARCHMRTKTFRRPLLKSWRGLVPPFASMQNTGAMTDKVTTFS